MSDHKDRRRERRATEDKSDAQNNKESKKLRGRSDADQIPEAKSRVGSKSEVEELDKKSDSKHHEPHGKEKKRSSRGSNAWEKEDDYRSKNRSESDKKFTSKQDSRIEKENKKSETKLSAPDEEDNYSSKSRTRPEVEKLDKRSLNKSDTGVDKDGRRSSKRTDRGKDDDFCERNQKSSTRTRNNCSSGEKEAVENEDESYMKAKRARIEETLTMKTGGAYIPPARLRMMQSQITDKASVAYQRLSWEALKKSINGLINKANISNLVHIVRELFQENIIRGRGLFSRSVMQAQAASPTFTHVYAAMVAIVNTKFPQIGELILKRLIIQFRKGYRRNDKNLCLSSARFIAHLVNQRVAHEVLSLEVLHVLLENPTNDSVELAIGFLKECGQLLTKVSPKGVNAVFERLRTILHEAQIDKRVQYMIEVMFAVRKDGFKDHPAVLEELDLVDEDDQITHLLALENGDNPEDGLNVFKVDENFTMNNEKYSELKREILGESSSDDDGDAEDHSKSDSSDSDDDSNESGQDEEKKTLIIDSTETNLVALRRTIYLTIQSSLDFEECAHKLVKMQMKPGQEVELCNMILDCCSQQRTFEKFYGLLAQRFCMIDRKYITPFQQLFAEQYEFVHRLETNKLRNISKLFAHLLHTDAISWEVIQCIHLNEDETTSSSRIFIKILFQELCEFMGLTKLNNRLKDPTLQVYFEGLFPRDNPRNTRFSINFFTSIGLGGLTDELRAHLKSVPKPIILQNAAAPEESSSDSDSSDSSDESSSSSSSSSEEEKPVPTRLSEFLHKQPAKSSDHRSTGRHINSSSNSKSTQNRLFALANYGGIENEEPPHSKTTHVHAAKEKHRRHEDDDEDGVDGGEKRRSRDGVKVRERKDRSREEDGRKLHHRKHKVEEDRHAEKKRERGRHR